MKNPVLWFEVVGKEGGKLQRFYKDVFGWEIAGAQGDESYGLVTAADGGIAGAVGQSSDEGHVTFFIEVDDPAAYLKKVEQAGGKTVVEPMEIPTYNLTYAYFKDPQGHLIGLSKGVAR
jgi:predicted enzyme related to lactoylglutathione lyase